VSVNELKEIWKYSYNSLYLQYLTIPLGPGFYTHVLSLINACFLGCKYHKLWVAMCPTDLTVVFCKHVIRIFIYLFLLYWWYRFIPHPTSNSKRWAELGKKLYRKMTNKISGTTWLSNEAGSCFLCRRLACEETREYFLNLFRDQSMDSELRIAAYLEVMRCPTYTIVKTIKHSLEVEEVNQG